MIKKTDVAAASLGCCVAIIIWNTLLKRKVGIEGAPILPPFHAFQSAWRDIRRDGVFGNFIGNICMFVPIGFFLPMISNAFQKWYRVFLIGSLFSFVIEVTQLLTARGYFESDDVILNVIGVMTGYFFCVQINRLNRKKQKSGGELGRKND